MVLEPGTFHYSGVQEGVLDAKRKRDDTVSRLQEFDATQTAALLPFEQDMQAMDTWIHNMEEMFTSNLTDIHFQTDRWAELVACSPPLTISTPTIEGKMCLREEEEEKSFVDTGLEVVDGILSGLFDVGKDFVTGIVDIVQDPKATLDATLEAVTKPIETYNTIKSAITTSYERDMVNGDANSRAHWVTYALGTVATSVVGTKGVGALTKSGVTVTKAVAPKVVGAAKNASDSLATLLPYGPRPQFAIAGQVPYNVVNGSELKDQLISMARVESGVKGADNGITKDEYKNLRKKTPSNDIRKMVNPDGPKVDPVYGYEVDKFEADHIVSMKEITEMDGFNRLTREQQIETLNLKDNFVGLGKSSNASKRAHSWADWKGHSKMGEVPVNVRIEMLEKEKRASEILKAAIEERLKK
ncbi:T7SS effector LXG polymorphic toxin [Psychrobacillus sp. FSL K6-1464]|uniref:T7SS effector LXG polymorphic toxin n=1 Tax=Psychrobacillus sp. FSL K6-1464 TaxID=2921545 RepID=UPI0030F4D25F